MNKPNIVIVAGGKNSRFYPLNTQTHKGFLPIVGKPIFLRSLENLKEYGFGLEKNGNKIVVVVSSKDFDGNGFSKYLAENNVAKELGLNIEIVLQNKAEGMGDALLSAKENILNGNTESFITASPYHLNIGQKAEELLNKKLAENANGVLSASHTENPELFGIIHLDEKDQKKVVGILEKPKQKISDPLKVDSLYLFETNFLNELSKTSKDEYSLENAITNYAKNNYVTWIKNGEESFSLKYPWHLFDAFSNIIKNQNTTISKSAKISKTVIIDESNGPVIVDENAEIGDFVKISGPCYIGKGVFVGDYSFIRGSSLELGVVVGANTEIVRSILFENSVIHYGYMSDSILGPETKVGAGLITANKRFDRKGIKVRFEDIKNKKDNVVDSRKEGLGIITGKNVQIGIRTNSMPGILIGENSTTYPGLTLQENVKKNQIFKG